MIPERRVAYGAVGHAFLIGGCFAVVQFCAGVAHERQRQRRLEESRIGAMKSADDSPPECELVTTADRATVE